MKKQEFINLSKNMVKEYVNAFSEERKVLIKNVYVIGFHDTPDNYRILLSIEATDDFFYEVVYDKNKKGIHSYVFKQTGNRIVGKRVTNRKGIA